MALNLHAALISNSYRCSEVSYEGAERRAQTVAFVDEHVFAFEEGRSALRRSSSEADNHQSTYCYGARFAMTAVGRKQTVIVVARFVVRVTRNARIPLRGDPWLLYWGRCSCTHSAPVAQQSSMSAPVL